MEKREKNEERKIINSGKSNHQGYGAGGGDTERHEYECPCGKGKIIEEHDNIPGFREHSAFISCNECSEKYELDLTNGVSNWKVMIKKN